MYTKEDDPRSKNFKGNTYLCGTVLSFVIWLTVLVFLAILVLSCSVLFYLSPA